MSDRIDDLIVYEESSDAVKAILARISREALRPNFYPDELPTVPISGPVGKRPEVGRRKAVPVPIERYTRSDRTIGIRAVPVRTEPRDYRGGYVGTGR